jgi:uncharacterized damage-inducible protein DinB
VVSAVVNNQKSNKWEFLLNKSSTDMSNLIQCNVNTLAVASDMINQLPADKYNHVERPYFESCLGKHIRHIVDHYLCFIRDLDHGVIDYERRQRDTQIETNKTYALSIINDISEFFVRSEKDGLPDRPLSVLLCSDVALPEGEATQSSVRRELQFLHGHSVHHYALIATMLRFYGVDMSREFGVAPSTLLHEKTVKVSA